MPTLDEQVAAAEKTLAGLKERLGRERTPPTGRTWISRYKGFGVAAAVPAPDDGVKRWAAEVDVSFRQVRNLRPAEVALATLLWGRNRLPHVSTFDLDSVNAEHRQAVADCLDKHDLNGTDFVEVVGDNPPPTGGDALRPSNSRLIHAGMIHTHSGP